VAYGGQVDADLVAAGVVGTDFDEGAVFGGGAAENFRSRGEGAETFDFAWVGTDAHLAKVARIIRDGRVDDDRRRNDSGTTREVSLLNLAGLQHSSKLVECFLITGRNHQTRSVGVESV